MIDEAMMQLAEQAIQKGERTKVLMEILLSELGFTIHDEVNIYAELKKVNDEYLEACKMLMLIVQESKKQTTPQNGSDYGSGQFEHLKNEVGVS